MTNSLPSIELDNNPQFGSFTQGFQPLYTDHEPSSNNESSNAKGRVDFDLNFEPANQRLDLVNEFDLEMSNNIKWLFKKDNIKVVQNKLQKNKKDRRKKKTINYDEIKKTIGDENFKDVYKLDEKFSSFQEKSKLNNINFDNFWKI